MEEEILKNKTEEEKKDNKTEEENKVEQTIKVEEIITNKETSKVEAKLTVIEEEKKEEINTLKDEPKVEEIKPIDEKQELIQKEIIDKNYNIYVFNDFLKSKKPYGDDLNNWEINELKTEVGTFLKHQKDAERIRQEIEKEKFFEGEKDDLQKLLENLKDNKKYTKEAVNCKKYEPSVLNNKKIEVSISTPKAIQTDLFHSNYIIYNINTSVVNWEVKRRYSDFEWLRITLGKFFPENYIPPMPKKKLGGRRFEMDFITKRMKLLQKFVNELLEREEYKASEPLISFLSISDRDMFEAKMKELNSIIISDNVEDIRTKDGIVYLSEEEPNKKYYVNINTYFRIQERLLEAIHRNLKLYYKCISASCEYLEGARKNFETLTLLNTRVLMKKEIVRTMEEFQIFCKNWKRIQYNENEIIKNKITNFFRYIQMEGIAFQELVTHRENLRIYYKTEYQNLKSKKERLWKNRDPSTWEITGNNLEDFNILKSDKLYAFSKMCTTESKRVDIIRQKFNHANFKVLDELKRLIKVNCFKYLDNAKDFCNQLYPSLGDRLNVWSEINSFAEIK